MANGVTYVHIECIVQGIMWFGCVGCYSIITLSAYSTALYNGLLLQAGVGVGSNVTVTKIHQAFVKVLAPLPVV